MKKKNGFTLIELLAVIIILGILMIIAIPSVTKYISDSRKNAYVDTAKEIIGSARNLINSGKQEMYDTDATYYLDVKCVKTENAMKSPYGDFVDLGAFVVVTYNGKGYSYYWTSVDDAGQGVKEIVSYDKLDTDSIESDLTKEDIKTNRTLDGRKKVILITDRNNCQKEGEITSNLEQVSSGTSGGNITLTTAASTILATAQEADQLNQIPDTNIYIFKGENPANYVSFNGETWRIIGIYGNQLKIQKMEAPSSLSSVKWYNDRNNRITWENSNIKPILNETYYNTLSDAAKNMIDENGSWNVGVVSSNYTSSQAYIAATTTKNLDGIEYVTPWIGKVGLIVSYEFLFATGGGETCLSKSGYMYNHGCQINWLIPETTSIWSMSPSTASVFISSISINRIGNVDSADNIFANPCLPVVFLKSTVKVVSGDGTDPTNAYVLEL